MGWVVICGLLLVGAAVGIALEPRQLWSANVALAALLIAVLLGFREFIDVVDRTPSYLGALSLVALFALLILMMVVLGFALLWNGLVMWRREGRSLGNSLSLLAGMGVLAYIISGLLVIVLTSERLFLWTFLLGLPLAYLSYGFLAYLLYSACYQRFTRRFAKAKAAVVVLGAGLIQGRVTPLLASRLDMGQVVLAQSRAAGCEPLLVVSGGRGRDEPRSEADAMSEYLVEHGVPAAEIVKEDTSRTTRENINNTKAILEAKGCRGKVIAVTNNFHAFRAATLMRRAKLPGQAVGAATASYFWPSAVLREYVALLGDSSWINKVGLLLSCVPLLGYAISQLP
ncbi:MAG: YdcF family protein [Propionibacteriaceae bacterium]|nr:YdcF family protein [Propionibacteriaceae bacterium]